MASINRFIKLKTVVALTGLSRTTIYRSIREGRFPKPAKIGKRASGWDEDEIDCWIRQRRLEVKIGINWKDGFSPSPSPNDLRDVFEWPLFQHVNRKNPMHLKVAIRTGMALMIEVRDILSEFDANTSFVAAQQEPPKNDGYSSTEHYEYLTQADHAWLALDRADGVAGVAWLELWEQYWRESWNRVNKTDQYGLNVLLMYLFENVSSWEFSLAELSLDGPEQREPFAPDVRDEGHLKTPRPLINQ